MKSLMIDQKNNIIHNPQEIIVKATVTQYFLESGRKKRQIEAGRAKETQRLEVQKQPKAGRRHG